MGYDLHITRAQDWSCNEGHEITPAEWLHVVQQDPSFKLDELQGPYFVLWTGDRECGKSGYPDAWFDWYAGNITTKNPDSPMIKKMVQIARKLNARVQGDDGETYTGNEEGYPIND